MGFTYENSNNGERVTFDEPHERLEGLDNWTRVGCEEGSSPDNKTGEDPEATPEQVAADLSDEELLAAVDEAVSRGLVDSGGSDVGGDGPGDPEESVEAQGGEEASAEDAEPQPEVSGQTEIDATAAAVELAEKEGIDLCTLTGTGEDGRIVLGDVRTAVEAQGGEEA